MRVSKVDKIKDLGVTFDKSFKFKEHIVETINKDRSAIGIVKTLNFMHLSEVSFCMYCI